LIKREKIKEVAKQIGERCHPEKVLLVGSYAYGNPTEDSDVDFLVIRRSRKRSVEQVLDISRAIDHPFPMDLIVYAPHQIPKRLRGGDLVLREMLEKGEVLYQAGR